MTPLKTPSRDAALDLLKWLAMLSMVLDHLRYVGWSANVLYVPGRLAFPWFCLAIAANLARNAVGPVNQIAQWRYLAWMLVFAGISELPYRLFMQAEATTLNVMPTLALGLLVARGWQQRTSVAVALAVVAFATAVLCQAQLMFGFFGVMLPLAYLWILRGPWYGALLPGLVCLASNAWPQMFAAAGWGDPISIGAIIVCLLAPLVGLMVLRSRPDFPVWPMRRWAYAIYPVHFLLLAGLRTLIA
ncbi:MAG: rane protein [Pseudomonas sp.]|nr:rane protein [Pseudomonas sp.]